MNLNPSRQRLRRCASVFLPLLITLYTIPPPVTAFRIQGDNEKIDIFSSTLDGTETNPTLKTGAAIKAGTTHTHKIASAIDVIGVGDNPIEPSVDPACDFRIDHNITIEKDTKIVRIDQEVQYNTFQSMLLASTFLEFNDPYFDHYAINEIAALVNNQKMLSRGLPYSEALPLSTGWLIEGKEIEPKNIALYLENATRTIGLLKGDNRYVDIVNTLNKRIKKAIDTLTYVTRGKKPLTQLKVRNGAVKLTGKADFIDTLMLVRAGEALRDAGISTDKLGVFEREESGITQKIKGNKLSPFEAYLVTTLDHPQVHLLMMEIENGFYQAPVKRALDLFSMINFFINTGNTEKARKLKAYVDEQLWDGSMYREDIQWKPISSITPVELALEIRALKLLDDPGKLKTLINTVVINADMLINADKMGVFNSRSLDEYAISKNTPIKLPARVYHERMAEYHRYQYDPVFIKSVKFNALGSRASEAGGLIQQLPSQHEADGGADRLSGPVAAIPKMFHTGSATKIAQGNLRLALKTTLEAINGQTVGHIWGKGPFDITHHDPLREIIAVTENLKEVETDQNPGLLSNQLFQVRRFLENKEHDKAVEKFKEIDGQHWDNINGTYLGTHQRSHINGAEVSRWELTSDDIADMMLVLSQLFQATNDKIYLDRFIEFGKKALKTGKLTDMKIYNVETYADMTSMVDTIEVTTKDMPNQIKLSARGGKISFRQTGPRNEVIINDPPRSLSVAIHPDKGTFHLDVQMSAEECAVESTKAFNIHKQAGTIRGHLTNSAANVKVILDDRYYTHTDRIGHFYFRDLSPGVYKVTIDEKTLPEGFKTEDNFEPVTLNTGTTKEIVLTKKIVLIAN